MTTTYAAEPLAHLTLEEFRAAVREALEGAVDLTNSDFLPDGVVEWDESRYQATGNGYRLLIDLADESAVRALFAALDERIPLSPIHSERRMDALGWVDLRQALLDAAEWSRSVREHGAEHSLTRQLAGYACARLSRLRAPTDA